MTNPDILLAIKPVIKAFDRLSIPYYIGGSVASSVYGMARATMDVDIIADSYHKSAIARRLKDRLVEDDQNSAFFLCSPEDVILSKLRWYEAGGRPSERQWLDVLGVIKVQSDSLNREYLVKWSNTLGVFDLLGQAFCESGVKL